MTALLLDAPALRRPANDVVLAPALAALAFDIRPLRPSDEAACHAFGARLTPDDLRLRFASPVRAENGICRRLFALDASHTVLVAVDDADKVLGIGRLAPVSPAEAEFALIVRSDLKGKGIGSRLLAALIELSRAAGLRAVTGDILAENRRMLRLAASFGFRQVGGPDLMIRMRLDLQAAAPPPLTNPETSPMPFESSADIQPVRQKLVRWEDPHGLARAGRTMSGRDHLEAIRAGRLPSPPVAKLVGFTVDAVGDGTVAMSLRPDESHYNPIGAVHGGIVATLLDSVMGCAVQSKLPMGRGYTTLEIKVNYLRAVTDKVPSLRAEGRVIHLGRQTAMAEASLLDPSGRLYAQATTTCLVFDLPAE